MLQGMKVKDTPELQKHAAKWIRQFQHNPQQPVLRAGVRPFKAVLHEPVSGIMNPEPQTPKPKLNIENPNPESSILSPTP